MTWPARWRWAAAAGAVALIGLGSGAAMVAGARKARVRAWEPEEFSRRAAAALGGKLGLTAEQESRVREILRRQREDLNRIGRQELALWPGLIEHLDAPAGQSAEEREALDRLGASRNAARWAALREINALLTPEQRKLYASYNVEKVSDLSALFAP